MRKIAVVTGTRAEYGLLYYIIKGVHDDTDLELQLLVTGTHLSPEYGMTVTDIEKDGFPISAKIDMLISSDTEAAISTSMGQGIMGFAKAYERLNPDIILLLGDRFEIHAAASAAVPFKIPVAHIHGGETTLGAMDELFRHSITKMSHIHFAAALEYADRIKQMGEQPENVFVTGAPGIDNIRNLDLLDKERLAKDLGLPVDREWGIVTFHPVTLEKESTEGQIKELLRTLGSFPDIYWLITFPNADTENRIIIKHINEYAEDKKGHASVFTSLGQLRYLSVLNTSSVMVGNSSSGIIEAPSFGLPVVNIGSRQEGRIRAKNIIDVPDCVNGKIAAAIKKSLSNSFRDSLKVIENPYGDGSASPKILDILKNVPLSRIIKKHFFDIKTDK